MSAAQLAPCMIDWNICKRYIMKLRTTSDNYHPFMFAAMDEDWNAVHEFYKADITIEDEFMFIKWCLENNKFECFQIIALKWNYDEMWKLFQEANFTERFTDEIKKQIWTKHTF